MGAYIARRLLVIPLLLWGLATITFAIWKAAPADPITTVVPARLLGNEEVVAAARERWGLDQSLVEQYRAYMSNLVQGDMGTSFRTRHDVAGDILERLPATLELAAAAMFLAVTFGVTLGVVAAINKDGWPDHLARVLAVTGSAMPVFWLGLFLLFVFWAELDWLPGPGRLDTRSTPPEEVTGFYTVDALLAGDVDQFWEALRHLVLPAFVLGWAVMGLIARLIRASMLDVLSQDYVRTARAKGLRERQVLLSHALRTALIPTLTVIGVSFAFLIAGAVLVEDTFSWPGLGRYTVEAAQTLDFPAIQGMALFSGAVIVLLNLLTDISYGIADPRIRLS
jgi:peptide/nickel transport system permease protein